MLVTVSKEDIAQGCRADGEDCPVARAVVRATGIPYAWVCAAFIAVYDTPEDKDDIGDYQSKAVKYWQTPEDAVNRIRFYDATGRMNRFEFEL